MFSGRHGLGPVRKGLDTDPVGQSDPAPGSCSGGRERLENPPAAHWPSRRGFHSPLVWEQFRGRRKMWAWLYGGGTPRRCGRADVKKPRSGGAFACIHPCAPCPESHNFPAMVNLFFTMRHVFRPPWTRASEEGIGYRSGRPVGPGARQFFLKAGKGWKPPPAAHWPSRRGFHSPLVWDQFRGRRKMWAWLYGGGTWR